MAEQFFSVKPSTTQSMSYPSQSVNFPPHHLRPNLPGPMQQAPPAFRSASSMQQPPTHQLRQSTHERPSLSPFSMTPNAPFPATPKAMAPPPLVHPLIRTDDIKPLQEQIVKLEKHAAAYSFLLQKLRTTAQTSGCESEVANWIKDMHSKRITVSDFFDKISQAMSKTYTAQDKEKFEQFMVIAALLLNRDEIIILFRS